MKHLHMIKTTISNLKLFDLHAGTYNSFYDEYDDSMSFMYVGPDRTMKVWCDNFSRHAIAHNLIVNITNHQEDIIQRLQVSYTGVYDLNHKDYIYSINNLIFRDGTMMSGQEYRSWLLKHQYDPDQYEDPKTWPKTLLAKWKLLH